MITLFKIAYTLLTLLIIEEYLKSYGPQNFLWISDVGLFLTLPALWLESPLLISICIAAFLIPELVWNLDFFIALIGKRKSVTGMSGYMFDNEYPLYLRALSLFHILLPPIWITAAFYWGYDPSALGYAVPLIWIILLLTYCCTDAAANINWVFMPAVRTWNHISNATWLIIMLVGYPLLVCIPTHIICSYLYS
jgi:hypothetical protein